ncbi:MAG: hypothetical protein HC819_00425 [Cyclobacteriaceae bacterium]|nr:hypothetical protein [Cyclobacteriaceae bacterium]
MILFLFIILSFSCEETFKDERETLSQETIDASVGIFAGEVLSKTTATGNDALWEISIKNQTGALVVFYWEKSTNLLNKIEGREGPFDYEMNPQTGALSLSTAKFLAFESLTQKVLSRWTLSRHTNNDLNWVYEFHFQGSETSILLDAISGEILAMGF